jgi:hypothetical protein
MFFFGDDDFEGEATVLDVSTNGCRAETSVEVKVEMQLKLSLLDLLHNFMAVLISL